MPVAMMNPQLMSALTADRTAEIRRAAQDPRRAPVVVPATAVRGPRSPRRALGEILIRSGYRLTGAGSVRAGTAGVL
jgi:hypothetical protein